MQVKHTRDSFGSTGLQSPALTEVIDLGNVRVDNVIQPIKRSCLVGYTDVVCIDELAASCDSEIICIDVEEYGRQY